MSVKLQNITLAYGQRTLLGDVSAHFVAGTLNALIGRNGAGKSTLLRVIAGLNAPQGGCVELMGRSIADYTPQQLATSLSFVTTDKVRIANLACEDVVALGRAPYTNWVGRMQSIDRQIVGRSLELVGMESFARKSMDQMSDGECQRIMIARALAQDTSVILLDEPTAFLDLPNRYLLASLLGRLAREQHKCIIFSTHELDVALALCDTVALIDSPAMHHLSPSEMISEGHVERLFVGAGVQFDPLTRTIRPSEAADNVGSCYK